MYEPFNRLINNNTAIDACGVYSVCMACEIQVQMYWPQICKTDPQKEYMTFLYNVASPQFRLSLLWANTKESTRKRFQHQPFKANHFSLLAKGNLTINRTTPIENNEDEEEKESTSSSSNWDPTETPADHSDSEAMQLEEKDSASGSDQFGELEEKQSEEAQQMDKKTTGKVNKPHRPIDYERVSTTEQCGGEKFRRWNTLVSIAKDATSVLADMRQHAATNKHGQSFVVCFKENRKKLLNKEALTWHCYDGQWLGNRINYQVFIRGDKDEPYKQDKTLTFDKDLLYVVFKVGERKGQRVPPEIDTDALVLARVDGYSKADPRYKRKITAFFSTAPEDEVLLDRMVYEYWGDFPGYISYGNTKVCNHLEAFTEILT